MGAEGPSHRAERHGAVLRVSVMTRTKLLACSFALAGLLAARVTAERQWTPQSSGVAVRLRGVSAVSNAVAWASGQNGTVVRTVDGGRTWQRLTVPGAEKLDLRDIDALDENVAYTLSIGPGDASRIFKTVDAGAHWTSSFVSQDPEAFFDAMAFWAAEHGIAISDSVG